MSDQMILADTSVGYQTKEVAVIVAAIAFVIVLGGVAAAAIIICGWRGAQRVVVDWAHAKVAFYCR